MNVQTQVSIKYINKKKKPSSVYKKLNKYKLIAPSKKEIHRI